MGRTGRVERDDDHKCTATGAVPAQSGSHPMPSGDSSADHELSRLERLKKVLLTYGKFVGPGFMISVAYSESAGC